MIVAINYVSMVLHSDPGVRENEKENEVEN